MDMQLGQDKALHGEACLEPVTPLTLMDVLIHTVLHHGPVEPIT